MINHLDITELNVTPHAAASLILALFLFAGCRPASQSSVGVGDDVNYAGNNTVAPATTPKKWQPGEPTLAEKLFRSQWQMRAFTTLDEIRQACQSAGIQNLADTEEYAERAKKARAMALAGGLPIEIANIWVEAHCIKDAASKNLIAGGADLADKARQCADAFWYAYASSTTNQSKRSTEEDRKKTSSAK